MEESALPFLPQHPARSRAGPAPTAEDPEVVARKAARLAEAVDRRLARDQPPPQLGPVRRPAPQPHLAGSIPLPFHASLHDPARVTGARSRDMKQFEPRVVACVACEYRKLENRMGDPAALGVDRRTLKGDQLQHFGPGERNYNLCQTCHDANGTISPGLFARWADRTMREDVQRTFRTDPRFSAIADRVAEIDRWRGAATGEIDLAAELAADREGQVVVAPDLDSDGEFDGTVLEERVPALSDYTGQTAGTGRLGTPDAEFAIGAAYDPERIGPAEAEAWMDHEAWEAARKENFRRAWERTADIENPELRQQAQARLVERWDPRMVLLPGDGDGPPLMAMTNPFAEISTRKTPFSRSAAHSGVDEGLSAEPAWKRSALSRHEAAVAQFLAEVRVKLARRRVPQEKIDALTTLPELNPGREVGKLVQDRPLHQRVEDVPRLIVDKAALPKDREPNFADRIAALRLAARPHFIAPAAALEEVAKEAAARRAVMDDVDRIGVIEAAAGSMDPAVFRAMAERAQQREAFQVQVREADAARDEALKWAGALHRSDEEVRGATQSFAREIRAAFRDPQAFQQAFKQLTDDEKRAALRTLRERPADFAREFGKAGELATGDRQGEAERGRIGRTSFLVRPPTDTERATILAASAGERYLDAIGSREGTRRHAARHLDLPEDATLKTVRGTCEARLAAATEKKAAAIRGRDALRTPTPGALEEAFGALHPQERRRMLKEVPGLEKMFPERRRELARPAPSL